MDMRAAISKQAQLHPRETIQLKSLHTVHRGPRLVIPAPSRSVRSTVIYFRRDSYLFIIAESKFENSNKNVHSTNE